MIEIVKLKPISKDYALPSKHKIRTTSIAADKPNKAIHIQTHTHSTTISGEPLRELQDIINQAIDQ